MYRILTASKDTYITNKIINNSFRATDANVGQAATLDLFKLYGESVSGSTSSPTEISRLLVKFDLNPLRSITGSFLDLDDSSFRCHLKLSDVYGGQTCPSNFNIIAFPLSRSFDEGVGMDVIKFSDLDACNFVTSSIVNSVTPVSWSGPGANKEGLLKSSDIDIISSGNLNDGNGIVNIWKSQQFSTGEEDLLLDVTTIISATLKGLIPDHGFRLSFSGSEESDNVTRFVKRFGSTQNSQLLKRPQLIVRVNDTIQDHHKSFYFNLSGSLFLNNFHRGVSRNILSGASATQIKGSNSIVLRLSSGSTGRGTFFQKIITGSQHKFGQNNFMSGVYSASFAVSQFSASNAGETRQSTRPLENEIKNAGSATFKEIWESLDGTVGYVTSSLVVYSVNRTSFDNKLPRLLISITNMQSEYRFKDLSRFRIFAENIDRTIVAKRLPMVSPSEIFTSMYYRVRDVESSDVVIPFDTSHNGTLCSTDSTGMYFDFYMSSLPKGRLFTIDFLVRDRGIDQIFTDVAARFRVI